jgi:hypothetical protein
MIVFEKQFKYLDAFLFTSRPWTFGGHVGFDLWYFDLCLDFGPFHFSFAIGTGIN